MKIIPVESGPVVTLGYLVYDELSRDALIIDVPLGSSDYFINQIKSLNLNLHAVLLTHSHWDHTADCPELRNTTNAPVFIFREDEYRLIDPMGTSIWKLPFNIDPMNADKYLSDKEIINLGTLVFEVINTPGHTEGGACFVFHSDGIVFTGDTLFNMSIGRTDLPGGDYEQLLNSIINRLIILPDDYKVLSGHGEPSTIGFERRNNPFINEYIKHGL
jgi:glyoxylase-like metal-dependent hydrolase (beta-lactamase superfamily II)